MATRGAPACPGLSFFLLYTPLIQKVINRFSFSFCQKMRRSFLVRFQKSRKNQSISLFDIYEKREGRAKSAPPPPTRARVNMILNPEFVWTYLEWSERVSWFRFQQHFLSSQQNWNCMHELQGTSYNTQWLKHERTNYRLSLAQWTGFTSFQFEY